MLESLSALVFAAAISSLTAQDSDQYQFDREVLECVSVEDCTPYLMRRRGVRHTDDLIEHLVSVYSQAGADGRVAVIEAIGRAERFEARPGVQVAMHLPGYTEADQGRILALVSEDLFSDATVLLGHVGERLALLELMEAQDGQYNRASFVDAVSVAGDRAIPVFLPYMSSLIREDREEDAWTLANGLRTFRSSDAYSQFRVPITSASIQMLFELAASTATADEERLAAMILLQRGGDAIRTVEEGLLEMARGEHERLAPLALSALMEIRNHEIVPDLIAQCQSHGLGDERYFDLYGPCQFDYFQFLGPNAIPAGPRMLDLLNSEHLEFRLEVIKTLAAIGYRPAVPRLRELLRSEYWSEVIEAANALRSLDDRGYASIIEEVASTHWLPFAREELELVMSGWLTEAVEDEDADDRLWRFPEAEACASGRWAWQGAVIDEPGSDAIMTDPAENDFGRRMVLDLGAFQLIGTDRGEWSGELYIQSGEGDPVRLVEDNVLSMQRVEGGAIVATGLNHMMPGRGNIYLVTETNDGWHLSHLTEATGPSYGGLVRVSDGVFAAFELRPQPGSEQFVSVSDRKSVV